MDDKERKYRIKRLRDLNPKKWDSLSEKRKSAMVELYALKAGYNQISIPAILIEGQEVSRSIILVAFGVFVGVFGGMAGEVIDRWLNGFGLRYEIAIVIIFIGIVWFLLVHLPEEIWRDNMKAAGLFDSFYEETKAVDEE